MADKAAPGRPMILTPEGAYVAALMWAPADTAGRHAAQVEAEDIADPTLRAVHASVTRLSARGIRADPIAVIDDIRELTGGHATAMTAELMADIYAAVPVPASVEHYAAIVRREAFARRLQAAGERFIQISQGGNTAEMVRVIESESQALDAMRQRLTDLARPVRAADQAA